MVRTEKLMPMKISNDTIGNRTRYLPACSAVPQPNAPPRIPQTEKKTRKPWQDSRSWDRGLIPEHTEYESGMLTNRPRRPIKQLVK